MSYYSCSSIFLSALKFWCQKSLKNSQNLSLPDVVIMSLIYSNTTQYIRRLSMITSRRAPYVVCKYLQTVPFTAVSIWTVRHLVVIQLWWSVHFQSHALVFSVGKNVLGIISAIQLQSIKHGWLWFSTMTTQICFCVFARRVVNRMKFLVKLNVLEQ